MSSEMYVIIKRLHANHGIQNWLWGLRWRVLGVPWETHL